MAHIKKILFIWILILPGWISHLLAQADTIRLSIVDEQTKEKVGGASLTVEDHRIQVNPSILAGEFLLIYNRKDQLPKLVNISVQVPGNASRMKGRIPLNRSSIEIPVRIPRLEQESEQLAKTKSKSEPQDPTNTNPAKPTEPNQKNAKKNLTERLADKKGSTKATSEENKSTQEISSESKGVISSLDRAEDALNKLLTEQADEQFRKEYTNILVGIREISQTLDSKFTISQERKDRFNQQLDSLEQKLAALVIRRNAEMASYEELLQNARTELEKARRLLDDAWVLSTRFIIYTILVFLISLSLAGLFIFLFNRIRKQKNELADYLQTVNQQSEEILQQNEEIAAQRDKLQELFNQREILLKEIHHRVKNNLQTIDSLLNLQSKTIDDQKALYAIRDGQSRVKSMALIHEKLYESENMEKIDFQDYVQKLLDYLAYSFDSDDKEIQYQINTEKVFFDLDRATSLGLIINELVSNIYKYAFVNQDKGEIQVALTTTHHQGYCLIVADNGVGLPHDIDIEKTKTLGLKLVKWLTEQLKGQLRVENHVGSKFILEFKMS